MVVILQLGQKSGNLEDHLNCQLRNLDAFSPVLIRPILVQIQFRSRVKELLTQIGAIKYGNTQVQFKWSQRGPWNLTGIGPLFHLTWWLKAHNPIPCVAEIIPMVQLKWWLTSPMRDTG